MTPRRRLARLVGLLVLWQGINLVERMVYAAGVADGEDAQALVENERRLAEQADELAAFDASDVLDAHTLCCGGPLEKA